MNVKAYCAIFMPGRAEASGPSVVLLWLLVLVSPGCRTVLPRTVGSKHILAEACEGEVECSYWLKDHYVVTNPLAYGKGRGLA